MVQKITQVDAFTNQAFKGNPAAVCIMDEPGDPIWMQKVAMEMNLAETAFLHKQEDGFNLRWFTPAIEVRLCGHATLASAHVLWEEGILRPDEQARFHTKSGLLTAERQGDWIELNFPAEPPAPCEVPPHLLEGLGGVSPLYVGKNSSRYLVELDSEATVRNLKPDFGLLSKLPMGSVVITSQATTEEFDFVSRYFAPYAGINEDPVTGSAHCCLVPYWAEKLGKTKMMAYQASARGGVLRVRLDGDRVRMAGQAVTVLRGDFYGSF